LLRLKIGGPLSGQGQQKEAILMKRFFTLLVLVTTPATLVALQKPVPEGR
jgi:hypothetical protein